MVLCQQITFAELAQTAPVPAPVPVPVRVSIVSCFLFPVSCFHNTRNHPGPTHVLKSPPICINGSKLPDMGCQSPSIIG